LRKIFGRIRDKLDMLRFGRTSEKRAARHMASKGYRIIEMNYRCRFGEIDIIARNGDTLVFCEVKARNSRTFGSPLEGITGAKIKRIRKTAEYYLMTKKLKNTDCRFDAVTVDRSGSGTVIEIIPNAF